jgi:hypothetical protein
MPYSTIKPKTGYCVDCPAGDIKPLIAGRCKYHYTQFRSLENKNKRNLEFKGFPPSTGLYRWYSQRVNEMTGICKNCGRKTSQGDSKYERFCIAHVLPKRKNMFPSVSTHKDNSIELCYWGGCHSNFDNKGWEWAATQPMWNLITTKFQLIYPEIAEEEKHRIPDVLLPFIPQEIISL